MLAIDLDIVDRFVGRLKEDGLNRGNCTCRGKERVAELEFRGRNPAIAGDAPEWVPRRAADWLIEAFEADLGEFVCRVTEVAGDEGARAGLDGRDRSIRRAWDRRC